MYHSGSSHGRLTPPHFTSRGGFVENLLSQGEITDFFGEVID